MGKPSKIRQFMSNIWNCIKGAAKPGVWKRHAILLVCLVMVAARFKWPSVKVDAVTIWLLVIAVFAFLWPEVRSLLPYIKTLKIAGVEIELQQLLRDLEKEVVQAQESVADEGASTVCEYSGSDAQEILNVAKENAQAALLLLASKIEEKIRTRMTKADITDGRRFMPLLRLTEEGVKQQLLPKDVLSALRDFWQLRNRVAHGAAFDVPDSTVMSLISLGLEILKIISVERYDG